jgi:hypothetical protein
MAVGLFIIWTSATEAIRRWWQLPAAGLVLWAILLMFPQYVDTDRTYFSPMGRILLVVFRLFDHLQYLIAVIVVPLTIWALCKISPPLPQADVRVIVTMVAGLLAVVFLWVMLWYVQKGEPIEVRSSWGGLGGAAGGWRVSAPMVCLVAAITFGTLAALVNMPAVPPPSDPKQTASDTAKDAPKDTAKDAAPDKKSTAPEKKGTAPANSQSAVAAPKQ